MVLARFRSKLFRAAVLATGVGVAGYYIRQNFIIGVDDYRTLVQTLQAKSTLITLSNSTVSNRFGPVITSTIPTDDLVESLGPEVKSFNFTMNVRQGEKEDTFDDFGEVLVTVFKIDNLWHIDSIQIRFFHSNYSKWLKLYECLHLKGKNCLVSTVKLEDLLSSSLLKDSDEYLKNFKKKQQFILKSVELFLNDREKLNNIGAPIRLISHDIFESDLGFLLKMNIEGRKKSADLLVDIEKEKQDWIISAMALMHEIKEDFILSNKELAEKYYEEMMKNVPVQEKWHAIFRSINLKKLLEDKLIKNDRIMTTIGRPIRLKLYDLNENKSNDAANKVKLGVIGRLNNGEFLITFKEDQNSNSWYLTNCEFKILWDDNKNSP